MFVWGRGDLSHSLAAHDRTCMVGQDMLADEAGGVLALYRADNQTDANNTLEQYSLRIIYLAMSVRRVCM